MENTETHFEDEQGRGGLSVSEEDSQLLPLARADIPCEKNKCHTSPSGSGRQDSEVHRLTLGTESSVGLGGHSSRVTYMSPSGIPIHLMKSPLPDLIPTQSSAVG